MNFYPRVTNDGSISLFNEDIADIYHSSIGAYTESLMKFVYPSGILQSQSDNINLLDICYGLGYNTKALLLQIHKKNLNRKISVTCLENDIWVLALSLIIKDDKTPFFIQKKIINSLLTDSLISKINYILTTEKFKQFISFKNLNYIKKRLNRGIKYSNGAIKGVSLHNIYYKYISNQNNQQLNLLKNCDFFDISFSIGDARERIQKLNYCFDYVFHDAFDPKKQALLWTKDFFDKLYLQMSNDSNLTTYTSSAVARGALKEAGFSLCSTLYKGKSIGTIAYKGVCKNSNYLSDFDLGLLETKAGISYKDINLSMDNNAIIEQRKNEVVNSSRVSSSSYIKESKNAKSRL